MISLRVFIGVMLGICATTFGMYLMFAEQRMDVWEPAEDEWVTNISTNSSNSATETVSSTTEVDKDTVSPVSDAANDTSGETEPSSTSPVAKPNNAPPVTQVPEVPKTTTPTPTPTTPQGYTKADVALHATEQSCWSIVNGSVYDLTSYVPKHPGGKKNILKICGKDGTSLFEGQHGGESKPEARLATLYKGPLAE